MKRLTMLQNITTHARHVRVNVNGIAGEPSKLPIPDLTVDIKYDVQK